MIHKLRKLPAVSAIALAAVALTATAGHAAENQAILDAVSFQTETAPTTTIRIVSTDGVRWNAIQEDNISLRAKMALDTAGAGFVRDVGIVLGECAGLSCQGVPYVWKETTLVRDYTGEASLVFPTSLIPISTPEQTASIPLGDQLISRCNEKLTAEGPVAQHSFNHPLRTSFIADTDLHEGNLAAYDVPAAENQDVVPHADFARSAAVMVNVVCEAPSGLAQNEGGQDEGGEQLAELPQPQPLPQPGGGGGQPLPPEPDVPLEDDPLFDPPFDPGFPGDNPTFKPFKVTGKLKLREYAGTDKTKPRLAYGVFKIKTNRPGKTGWKVTCTGGRQWTGKKLAIKVGPKKWQAVAKVNFHIAKTELVRCKLRSTSKFGHPVLDTAKRLYKVTPPNPGIGDELADGGDPLKITGVLGLFELPGTNKTKPRNAQAKFAVFTNRPGKTSWKLSCSGGRKYSGTHTVTKVGFKKYRLRLKRTFHIAKSQQVKCVLRSKTLNNKFLAKAKRYYKVKFNVNPEVGGGPGDLQNPLNPTHDQANGPNVLKPIPLVGALKPKCIGGTVISTRKMPPKHSCLCPTNKKKRKIGRNAFKCSAKFAKVKPGKLKDKLEAAKRLRELRKKEAAKRAALKRAKAKKAAQKAAAAKRAAAKKAAAAKRAAAKKAAAAKRAAAKKAAAAKRAAAKKAAAAKRAAAKKAAAAKRAAAKKAAAAKRAAAKRAAAKRAAAKRAAAKKAAAKRLQAKRQSQRGLKVAQ